MKQKKQKIECKDGRCYDMENLLCEQRYDNIIDQIECELIEKQEVK